MKLCLGLDSLFRVAQYFGRDQRKNDNGMPNLKRLFLFTSTCTLLFETVHQRYLLRTSCAGYFRSAAQKYLTIRYFKLTADHDLLYNIFGILLFPLRAEVLT